MAHPYQDLPDSAFWRRSVSDLPGDQLDPVGAMPFAISRDDRIATAGSCFAQHVGRYLSANHMNYLVTEPPHPLFSEAENRAFNYGIFTARYGNIYTAGQLRQLMERAYGQFTPRDNIWRDAAGCIFDPFRPRIQPGGFETEEEYRADRERHFEKVREAIENLDVLVFTLGLTECWRSWEDGAIYPLCPGVAAGEFDSKQHLFHNFTVGEVIDDLRQVLGFLHTVNPSARMVLTVSPVPLMATARADQHVLAATTYSKSVLRVAAEEIARQSDKVAYFPSYEIIAGSGVKHDYFGADRRSVSEAGVSHVMRMFMRHLTDVDDFKMPSETAETEPDNRFQEEMAKMAEADCDEEMLDYHRNK